ncbi:class I SAM-dependent methyltransferase [Myxococcota bacterium]|nr:class I SAM-dependent methyltransferase [Myxococcota bacterium]
MAEATSDYPGDELTLFAEAKRWKRYLASLLHPYLGQRVLEVGAGLGANTRALCSDAIKRWVCLEPDRQMAESLEQAIVDRTLPGACEVRWGGIDSTPPGDSFDTVLYIDVLEHILDDAGELEQARKKLDEGGHLVVVAPAHDWLMTPFDERIGHHRRYSRRSLAAAVPGGFDRVSLRYIDSVGLIASLANRLLLRQSMPTPSQIATWDRLLVPLSRGLADPLLVGQLGKSVMGVWSRSSSATGPLSG